MREFFEQSSGRLPRHTANDDDPAALLLYETAFFLVNRVDRIIASLCVDVGFNFREQFEGIRLRENANAIYSSQRSENGGAFLFAVNWAIWPFDHADRFVAVYSHQQGVAGVPRSFKVRNMTQMKEVETPIGDYEFLAPLVKLIAPSRQTLAGEDFLTKIHLAQSCSFARKLSTESAENADLFFQI
jgi:hypothetical protein